MGKSPSLTELKNEFAHGLLVVAQALGFDLDSPTISVYWRVLEKIPREIRKIAFAEAIERQWFKMPQPAELKTVAIEIMMQKRVDAANRIFEKCPHPGHWLENAQGAVTGRCACWHKAQDAMAAIGEPPALPAIGMTTRDSD